MNEIEQQWRRVVVITCGTGGGMGRADGHETETTYIPIAPNAFGVYDHYIRIPLGVQDALVRINALI